MSDEQGETVDATDADDGAPDESDTLEETADEAAAAEAGTDATDDTEDAEAGPTTDVEAVAEELADRDAGAVATEVADLRERVESLEADLAETAAERDDLEDRLKRKAAEFQNYKKRQEKQHEEVRERATEDLVEQLLEVRDNLDRALEQEEGADIREGVEATFRQLDEILAAESVEPIEPSPGAEVDPARHEVLLNVESDQPAGTVAEVHRPGYEMAEKVLRPAQVTVAEGDPK